MMADKTEKSGSTLGTRPSASRKLLTRKAVEKAGAVEPNGEALEDMFPAAEGSEGGEADADKEPAAAVTDADPAPAQTPPMPTIPAPINGPTAPQAATGPVAQLPCVQWSDEDERAFQGLAAKRKAAGFIRRGKDTSGQLIGLGSIKPNPDTVVAVLVGLVTESGGSMPRTALVDAMAKATFPHPKAQPADRGWCQGYIAGAVRNGFLAMVAAPSTAEAA